MSSSKRFATSLALLPLWGLAVCAQAQPEESREDSVFALGEIVVEGSSGVKDIAITNTVTAEEIRSIGATNAGEALKYVPGVNVVQTTKGEVNINIQGFSQKDILVLIDGVPYYETQNGPLDLQQIPASIIAKIEVTKGASSVLYGPNALGGVVNIVTQQGVEGFSGTAGVELGRDGYNRDVASINYGNSSGFTFLGSVDYRRRDALRFSSDYEPRASSIKGMGRNTYIVDDGNKKENSDLESLNLWSRFGYAPTEALEMYASVYRFDLERGRLFSDSHNKRFFESSDKAAFTTFGRYDSYEDTGIDLGSRYTVNDTVTLRALAFYHKHEDDYSSYEDWTITNKLATSTWNDDAYGASLFSDLSLGRAGELSVTAQYRVDKHKQRGDYDFPWEKSESDTFTLAAEDTITFGQFTAVAGIGYSHFDAEKIADSPGYSKDTVDPMAGLTWVGENGLQLFGSIAKKTRFPTFNDMEDDGEIYVLDPEENTNYTLGAAYTFWGKSDVTLAFFYNDVSDKIADARSGDGMENIDSVEIYGVELVTDTRLTDRFSVGFDYVYTHARDTSAGRSSDHLEDVPEHQAIAKLGYRIPNIEAVFEVRGTLKVDNYINIDYDSRNDVLTEEDEDSFVVDLSLLKDWDNGFSLGAYVYNLFDADFYEGDGMASNGLNFKVVAQYNF